MINDLPDAPEPERGRANHWQAIAQTVLQGWSAALTRDVSIVVDQLSKAESGGPGEDSNTHLEICYWRLAAAHEKLEALTALLFGSDEVLKFKKSRRMAPGFRPRRESIMAKLGELAEEYPEAERATTALTNLRRRERWLTRHQLSHSLAPLGSVRTLAYYETGILERGQVVRYQSELLYPQSSLDNNDVSEPALHSRACIEARRTLDLVELTVQSIAALASVAGAWRPITRVWQVAETNRIYQDLEEARTASRRAAAYREDRPGH